MNIRKLRDRFTTQRRIALALERIADMMEADRERKHRPKGEPVVDMGSLDLAEAEKRWEQEQREKMIGQ